MTKAEKRFLKRFAGRYKGQYVLYFLLVVLMSVFSVATILSMNNFLQVLFGVETLGVNATSELDELLNRVYAYFLRFGKMNALVYFTIIIVTVYFFKDLFTWLSLYQIGSTRNKILRDIRNALFEKVLGQDLAVINKYKKGDLLSRFSSDIIEFDETMLKAVQTIINSVVVVLLYLVMLFYIDYRITFLALATFPVVAFITSLFSRKLRGASKRLQSHNAKLVSIVEQSVAGIRIIKSLTAIDYVNDRFRNFNEEYTRLRNKVYRRVDLSSPQSEFLSSIVIAVILLFGSYSVLTLHNLSSGMFIVYLVLFILIIKPAKDASTAYYNLKRSAGALNRIMEVINTDNVIKEPADSKPFPNLQKGITFKNVTFAYKEGENVLDNINFTFEKGKVTAVVGASGSGKTTLIDLIEKFYQLDSAFGGDILFDDVSVNDISGEQIRKNIAVVTQQTILFNDTVASNIAFGGDYTQSMIENAARIANASSFIEQLPQKYDTNIGDKGDKLSGGQKQRISIARAVLKNSPILILDEATSALDTESERKVQQALDNISKDRTSIVIAHRLSTVVNADKIIVLQDGRIKEQGTHTELYNLGGIYYNLYKMQQIG